MSKTVRQGEFEISTDPDMALFTVLGSCVSVCFHDVEAKVGGMNHYLLPVGNAATDSSVRYGLNAMELLINGLLKSGAERHRLTAQVYGGAQMTTRFKSIGPGNIDFALTFLKDEGFDVTQQDLGGTQARKLYFHPVTGLAKCVRNGSQDPTDLRHAPSKVKRNTPTLF